MAITFFGETYSIADSSDYGNTVTGEWNSTVVPPGSMQQGDLVIARAATRTTTDMPKMGGNQGGQDWIYLGEDGGSAQTTVFWYCTFNGTWTTDVEFIYQAPKMHNIQTLGTAAGRGATTNITFTSSLTVFRPTNTSKTFQVDVGITFVSTASSTTVSVNPIATVTNGAVAFVSAIASQARTMTKSADAWTATPNAQLQNLNGSDTTMTSAYQIMPTAGTTGTCAWTIGTALAYRATRMAFKEV